MASSDHGIVLFSSGDGTGSFVGRDGNPGVVRTLSAANFIAGPWIDVGRFAELYVTIAGTVSAQMASVVVLLERRRADDVNPIFSPALIATTRADDPAAGKLPQQTITRAQLVGQDVSAWPAVAPAMETLDVVLITTDHRWSGGVRVLVKATNAPLATDRIAIGMSGGG